MKNSIKRVVALAVASVMLLCMVPFVSADTADFTVAAGEVVADLGATSVEVPVDFTKMYTDTTLGCVEIRVHYDNTKLDYESISFGSMVPNATAD
ncbi:MAG: cohesin domain-containing protein, partial [Eubacteriales bacterium]|nr:cohesin domain-containing protein [Eubacteriales bacterium]